LDNGATEDSALDSKGDLTQPKTTIPVDDTEPIDQTPLPSEPLTGEEGAAATFIPGLPLQPQTEDPCIEDPSLPECQESGTNSEEDSADETSEEDPEAYEEDYYYE
jgi:hypothetical protein